MSTSNSAMVVLLQQTQTSTYFNVASFAVLIHDWFLTVDSELTFVWGPRWNLGTLLYFLTRYTAFVDTPIFLYSAVGYSIPPPVCDSIVNVSTWMFLFGISVAELIMMFCVWAMWGRERRMAIGLIVLTLAAVAVGIVGILQNRSSAVYIDDLPPNIPGCLNITPEVGIHDTPFFDFLALTIFECVLFALMLFKAVEHGRRHSSTFVLECFRHGLLYYVVLSALSIINLAITIRGGHESDGFLISTQRTFHAILSARMLLHLRRSAHQTRDPTEDTTTIYLDSEVMFQDGSGGP
ncbi:hypothetical protein BD779DRAFT_105388 [Infundibulicybe gibba]|nr:hypothetical protein BD779DRAFT_105388 [Infundibulicybe gibba]